MALLSRHGRRGFLLGKPAIIDDRSVQVVATIAWTRLASIGVACMTCRDTCLTGAIRFSLLCGGAIPHVETGACTGCADYAPVWPVSAIASAAKAKEPPLA